MITSFNFIKRLFELRNKNKVWIRVVFCSVLLSIPLYSIFIGSKCISLKHVRLSGNPAVKILHFSDLHFKGDNKFLERLVDNNIIPSKSKLLASKWKDLTPSSMWRKLEVGEPDYAIYQRNLEK